MRLLAPDLRRLFRDLNPLIDASKKGLAALTETLKGTKPLLSASAPFLGQLNPILDFLGAYSHQVSDFIGNAASGLAAHAPTATPGATGHILRQMSPFGQETLGLHRQRLATNRGNTYLNPLALSSQQTSANDMFPNWDCNNTPSKGPQPKNTAQVGGSPACIVQSPLFFQGRTQGSLPHVEGETYAGP